MSDCDRRLHFLIARSRSPILSPLNRLRFSHLRTFSRKRNVTHTTAETIGINDSKEEEKKMSLSFTDKFSRDFAQLLENDTTHNVIIKTGSRKNTRDFYAHSMILRARSSHFRTARYRKTRDGLMHFTKPNISPDVFEIILRLVFRPFPGNGFQCDTCGFH